MNKWDGAWTTLPIDILYKKELPICMQLIHIFFLKDKIFLILRKIL